MVIPIWSQNIIQSSPTLLRVLQDIDGTQNFIENRSLLNIAEEIIQHYTKLFVAVDSKTFYRQGNQPGRLMAPAWHGMARSGFLFTIRHLGEAILVQGRGFARETLDAILTTDRQGQTALHIAARRFGIDEEGGIEVYP